MADTIRISELTVDCVVGVYPDERDTPQPLTVELELSLDTQRAATRERMRDTVDYESVAGQVGFLLRCGRFRLLETAAHVLAKQLLAPPVPGERRAAVDAVRIRLTKHGALGGIAVPSLEIARDASWLELAREDKPFGTVDVVHETRDAGIYRLNVEPGRGIPLHMHRRMQESEMVLTEGLRVQNRAVPAGTVHRWPLGTPHRYDNPSDRVQSILCVDAPPFMEDDEIRVQGELAPVSPETPWGGPMKVEP